MLGLVARNVAKNLVMLLKAKNCPGAKIFRFFREDVLATKEWEGPHFFWIKKLFFQEKIFAMKYFPR